VLAAVLLVRVTETRTGRIWIIRARAAITAASGTGPAGTFRQHPQDQWLNTRFFPDLGLPDPPRVLTATPAAALILGQLLADTGG